MQLQQLLQSMPPKLLELVIALLCYSIVELITDLIKKSRFWFLRLLAQPIQRFLLGEFRYLHSLVQDESLSRRERRYATLRAVRARLLSNSGTSESLLQLLSNAVQQRKHLLVLGQPGAGKTTSLQVLTYQLARQAYQRNTIIIAGTLITIAIAVIFVHPILFFTLLGAPLLDRILRRCPLPLLVELRTYNGEPFEEFLKRCFARRTGGNAIADKMQTYIDLGRVVWIFDGVNEIRGDAYDRFLDSWREHTAPGSNLLQSAVIFTSRVGENPADRMQLEHVVQVLDLDDTGVRGFLRVYGSKDIPGDFTKLERNRLLGEGGLGRNPYWLNMVVESDSYTKNRGALFENFTRTVIARELDKSPIRPHTSEVPIDDEMRLLSYIALGMANTSQIGMRLSEAQNIVKQWSEYLGWSWVPDQIFSEAEAATLMRISYRDDRIEFFHQLVQEFFVAYALRDQPGHVVAQLEKKDWWEIALMLGGLLDKHYIEGQRIVGSREHYRQFVLGVLGDGTSSRRLFLAVSLLQSVDSVEPTLKQHLTDAMIASLQQGITPAHKQAAVELAQIASDEVVEALGDMLQGSNLALKYGAIEILEELRSRKAIAALIDGLSDNIVVTQIAQALQTIGDPAILPLITALESSNANIVKGAIYALGVIADPQAIEPLIAALRKQQYAGDVGKALRSIGKPAVPALLTILTDPSAGLRYAAIVILRELQDNRCVEPFITLLNDESPRVRRASIKGLKTFNDARAITQLINVLGDSEVDVRQEAVETLIHFGHIVVKPLIQAIQVRQDPFRSSAAQILVLIGVAAVDSLVNSLNISDAQVREILIGTLVAVGEPAVLSLLPALKHHDVLIRCGAAQALGRLHDVRAVEPLHETLRNPRAEVRYTAAQALGELRDPRSIEPLIEALRDDDDRVQQATRVALGAIGEPAIAPLSEALEDKDSETRRIAAVALGYIGPAAEVPLRRALEDIKKVRAAAALALAQIGNIWGLEGLLELVAQSNAEQRQRVLESIRSMNGVVVEPLITMLKVSDVSTRSAAAQSLGYIGDSQAVAPLLACLDDPETKVVQSATRALQQIGIPAITSLLERLGSSKSQIRKAATEALGQIGEPAIQPLALALYAHDNRVAQAAAEALKQIGQPAVPFLIALLHRDEQQANEKVGRTLLKIGKPAVDALIAELENEHSSQRHQIARLLGQIKDGRAIEPLIRVLNDNRTEVQTAALDALHEIGRAAIKPLIQVVQSQQGQSAVLAAKLIGEIGGPQVLPALREISQSIAISHVTTNARLRFAVYTAIAQIEGRRRKKAG